MRKLRGKGTKTFTIKITLSAFLLLIFSTVHAPKLVISYVLFPRFPNLPSMII